MFNFFNNDLVKILKEFGVLDLSSNLFALNLDLKQSNIF